MTQLRPSPGTLSERAERLDLHLPLTFLRDDQELPGYCVNVSGTGMLATFARPLELWVTGTLSLLAGDYYLTLAARVARTQDRDAGFSFLLQTDNDRRAILLLLEAASARTREANPPPTLS